MNQTQHTYQRTCDWNGVAIREGYLHIDNWKEAQCTRMYGKDRSQSRNAAIMERLIERGAYVCTLDEIAETTRVSKREVKSVLPKLTQLVNKYSKNCILTKVRDGKKRDGTGIDLYPSLKGDLYCLSFKNSPIWNPYSL